MTQACGRRTEGLHTRKQKIATCIAVINLIRNLRGENLVGVTLEQDSGRLTIYGKEPAGN